MNATGRQRAEQLAQKEYSLIEYRNRLVRMQNMDCICHCSAEIDQGTLLYFSVNDFFLGQGVFVLLLFSEVSAASAEQRQGQDVFGRMFTYAMIEELAREAFTGHYSFFSSELDGRLVLLLNFPFGLLPDRSIVDFLDDNCREVSRRCQELYDMQVVTYVGDPIDDLHAISAVYSKLLETATLHRYTGRGFDDPVFHVTMPDPNKWSLPVPAPENYVQELFRRLFDGGDIHAAADEVLALLAQERCSNVDELKRSIGDYFEDICLHARELGIKLKYDALRDELFRSLFDSVDFSAPVLWLHGMLDRLLDAYGDSRQQASQKQFDAAVAYIDAHLHDPNLTPELCAAQAGCSVSSLRKTFRRRLNISPSRYIRDKRLDMALELLRGGASVGETCTRCGFGSTETFHRAFKAKFGITPGQLKQIKDP